MLIIAPVIFTSAQHSLQLVTLFWINGSYLLALMVLPYLDVYTSLHAITITFRHMKRTRCCYFVKPLFKSSIQCFSSGKEVDSPQNPDEMENVSENVVTVTQ